MTDEEPATPGVFDGTQIAVFGQPGWLAAPVGKSEIVVWSLESGEVAWRLDVPQVRALAADPDGSTLAASTINGDVLLIDIATQQVATTLPQPSDATSLAWLAFNHRGSSLVSLPEDGQGHIWDVAQKSWVAIDGQGSAPRAAAFHPDGDLVAISALDAPVQVVDAQSGAVVTTVDASPDPGYGLAFSPSGDTLVTSSTADPAPGRALALTTDGYTLSADLEGVLAIKVAHSPSGSLVAVADSGRREIVLWDTASGQSQALPGHTDKPRALAFGGDGTAVYSASAADGVIEWDVATGAEVRRFIP